ncbi:MAG: spore cortex biosynthesis protein YabQ [Clostridiales bacterium]|nr:spore cortex biosynthesis protein YabQ [Candidatus Cacconaster stercorequi]
MENYVSEQLGTLASAVLLGGLGAWLYDVLRAVRRRRQTRAVTHLTDGLYAALWLLVLLGFALHRGQGELRLYVIAGIVLGAVCYFLLLSFRLRPLWDFWTDTAAVFGRILLWPLQKATAAAKKVAVLSKKYFQFLRKYDTIKKYKWEFTRARSRTPKRGGRSSREQQKERKQEP